MKSIDAIINSGIIQSLEQTQDLMNEAAYELLSDEKGVSACSYVALMAVWRQIDPSAARLCDVECSRCSDGRYRLSPDSDEHRGANDFSVDVTTLQE